MRESVSWNITLLWVLLTFSVAAHAQSPTLFPVAQNDLWGFADKSGTMIIAPAFDQAFEFHEGLANVRVSGKYGFIDQHGTLVIKAKYDSPSEFSEGLAAASIDGKKGYIDHTGKMVIPPTYSSAGDFNEGLAAVEVTVENKERGFGYISTWGYIDKNGTMIIPAQFYEASAFSQGRAAVSMKGGHAYIDSNGALIFGPEDTGAVALNCQEFSNGLAPILSEDKVGFIDLQGRIAIKPQFDDAGCFSEGLARVKIGDKYGFIDLTGRVVIPPAYSFADRFSEGLAATGTDEAALFYINKKGEKVIRGPFRKAKPFAGGFAFVEDDVFGMGGYIDTSGTIFNRFRIPEHGCPICAVYSRPLLDMEIDSKPEGATVYLVPVYTFEHQSGIEADDAALSNFRLPYGTTNVSCKACVYEQKYWAIFVSNKQRCRMLIDVLHASANKFSTNLDNPVAGLCR
jgi:hypothetical protein